jgi:hypothetical protein
MPAFEEIRAGARMRGLDPVGIAELVQSRSSVPTP